MSLLWPMLAQIGWTFLLYVWLTVARQRAVKAGEVKFDDFARHESRITSRASRTISPTSSSFP